jgi:hypothetical protein
VKTISLLLFFAIALVGTGCDATTVDSVEDASEKISSFGSLAAIETAGIPYSVSFSSDCPDGQVEVCSGTGRDGRPNCGCVLDFQ